MCASCEKKTWCPLGGDSSPGKLRWRFCIVGRLKRLEQRLRSSIQGRLKLSERPSDNYLWNQLGADTGRKMNNSLRDFLFTESYHTEATDPMLDNTIGTYHPFCMCQNCGDLQKLVQTVQWWTSMVGFAVLVNLNGWQIIFTSWIGIQLVVNFHVGTLFVVRFHDWEKRLTVRGQILFGLLDNGNQQWCNGWQCWQCGKWERLRAIGDNSNSQVKRDHL